MGYDAVLPGEADFQLGSSLLRGEGTKGFPWTCLNLVSVKTGKPVFAPFRKVRRGNLDVTVVGLIGEGKFSKGSLAGLGWAVRPPHSTLREFLEGKEGRADVVVVLSHLGDDGDVALARSVRRPVIILEGHVATSVSTPAVENGAAIFRPPGKGTHLLEVALTRPPGANQAATLLPFASATTIERYKKQRAELSSRLPGMDERRRRIYTRALDGYDNAIRGAGKSITLSDRLIPLDREQADDPRITPLVAGYKRRLKALSTTGRIGKRSSEYMGHPSCKSCHPKNSNAWESEAHSHALDALKKQGDEANPDCLPCHTTGYERGGFHPGAAGDQRFSGVGCEACHGPGKGHPGKPMTLPAERLCLTCHSRAETFSYPLKRSALGCVRAGSGRVQ